MITRPFNFESHLRRPSSRFDLVPFLDVCLIVLFFGLLGSRFILAPGFGIQLPDPGGEPPNVSATTRVVTVEEVGGGERLLFEGRIHNLDSFTKLLEEHSDGFAGEILMVQADVAVTTRVLARLMNVAARVGFAQVLFAAEPEPAANRMAP